MIRSTLAAAALLAASPAFADEVHRQISVTGEGAVSATPDLAILTFGVRSQAETASEAFSGSTKAMNDVLAALDAAAIEPRDRQTSQLRINPIYARRQNSFVDRSQIEGYEALSTLTVRLRDIDSAGSVIDAAVKAGANGLDSFRLGFDDPKALQDQARIEAVKDAMAKA
ncbi:MAG: SIMPL domain-containing protein [Pseudomonadota bacterium]